jgi:hypothetical protein
VGRKIHHREHREYGKRQTTIFLFYPTYPKTKQTGIEKELKRYFYQKKSTLQYKNYKRKKISTQKHGAMEEKFTKQ